MEKLHKTNITLNNYNKNQYQTMLHAAYLVNYLEIQNFLIYSSVNFNQFIQEVRSKT